MAPQPELYPTLHRVRDLETAGIEDLQQIIQTFPVIDNHAHNMLTEENAYGSAEYPFECITSEAQGHALTDHVHTSLAHMRGVKHLAEFYQCPETLQDVKAARYEWVRRDYPGLIKKCFEGTHAIMMDDGLSPEIIHSFKWHRQFVPTVSRIVRIEAVASELLEHLAHAAGFMRVGLDADWDISQTESFLVRFNTVFRNQIRTLANDPDVRGFKSVICYRSGLDIGLESRKNFRPHQSLTESSLLQSFHDFLQKAVRDHKYRIQQKEVNDFLVVAVCDVLEKLVDTDGENLPFQFHTGLGDTDIDLVKANPAYMQPLIEAFPQVDFVILHSSYPYTREAGYLAANYSNAWLDIGEAFPMLSRDGEESVLRQALELTPSSKILWSTDGHFYPETYWLANKHFREALERLLTSYIAAGDVTVAQAIDIAVDIMFWNSNLLYKLDEERKYPELLRACGREAVDSMRTLVNGGSKAPSFKSYASTAVAAPAGGASSSAAAAAVARPGASLNAASSTSLSLPLRSGSASAPSGQNSTAILAQNVTVFDAFLQTNPGIKYMWVQYLDYTGTLRNRMMTVQQFKKQLSTGKPLCCTTALTRLMQDDYPATGCSATGQFLMIPDLSTLSLNKGISSPSATVQTWWMADSEQVPLVEHYDRCPRWLLQSQADALKSEFNISMLVGFELEIIFMRPVLNENKSDFVEFEPLHMVHSWSNMTWQQIDMLPIIEEIVENLGDLDIHLSQFHSEAAPGQWEFPLPAFEPVKAVDVLFKAKDVIRNVAKKHGLKATCYPRPYAFSPGSANHAHFSINGPGDTVEKYEAPFLAGVLEHLPALIAFLLPFEESYQRVNAGIWAGGEYVCWGTQNKEVPLRKCGPGHFELKTVDGMGNSYLSMAALLASGLHGLRQDLKLEHKDCTGDPTGIGEEERQKLGITTQLPNTLEKSLKALDRDKVLRRALGYAVVDDYLAVSESLMAKLRGFGDEKRRVWLMARY
ncbi:Glutamine synthetase, catalytic domain-containing protein isoform 1 [Cladophialophora immunda]|nr:Glutamine synthetase, catalytic domain-containing protein isoform 1 [Cladophialophora immunda]